MPKEIYNLTSDDYHQQIGNLFFHELVSAGCSIYTKEVSVNAKYDELYQHIVDLKYTFISGSRGNSIAISHDMGLYIKIRCENWYHTINIYGKNKSVVDWQVNDLTQSFESNPCFIDWVHDEKYFESMRMPLSTLHMPITEMYPWLESSIEEYYDKFVNSSANILILIGQPGTGKTTFIRGLLAHSQKSATLTHNKRILSNDGFFVDWLSGNNDFLVIEDSDSLLIPRTEGNDMMSKFLNIGDGLMTTPNKKMIFSTNLTSVSDIDTALTRPGRCFDIAKFGTLNADQVKVVANKFGIDDYTRGVDLTVSEIFSNIKKESRIEIKKVGFY